jgi:hypothetical protein
LAALQAAREKKAALKAEKEAEKAAAEQEKREKQEKAEKEKQAKAEARAKAREEAKLAKAAPAKTKPKRVTIKENAQRLDEAKLASKVDFEARVARQVQAELKRQKAIERLEREEQAKKENVVYSMEESELPQVPPPQQPRQYDAAPQHPKQKMYMIDDTPVYLRKQRPGDEWLNTLLKYAK